MNLVSLDQPDGVDAQVIAVAHQSYREMGLKRLAAWCDGRRAVVVDGNRSFDPEAAAENGSSYWRL